MQKIRYSFLFVIGLALIFGTASDAFSQKRQKRQKNFGYLSVTSPEALPVRIDEVVVGMSNDDDFPLREGKYNVEVEGPDGQLFKKRISIKKRERICICLKLKEITTTEKCPYNIEVQVDKEQILEGDNVVFTAVNLLGGAAPVNYRWRVSGGTIISGQNTSSITVSSKGMGGQRITAYVDVKDDIPGSTCFQMKDATTYVEKIRIPEPIMCDLWESKSADDDKARFDNCTIIYRQNPNSQIFIILYQGTDKGSISVEKLAKRALDYFRQNLGISAGEIVLRQGGNRPRTSAQVWIVPPGAPPPLPQ